ncbi:hypothetical protein HZB78_02065 [Candidatus Collierbacteria bacterium]|nr:hypothetical protein [Candidatus Collierbacteria bacterium]
MITDTKEKIIQFIKLNGRARIIDLKEFLGIGNTAIHRQLKRLVSTGVLMKAGTAPKVFYVLEEENRGSDRNGKTNELVEKTFLYVSPSGEMLSGRRGFEIWAKKADREINAAMIEYVETRGKANTFIGENGWIDATEKIKNTFKNVYLDKVLYKDFYAMPVFGKTRLGQLVLYGKQSQDLGIIRQTAKESKELIEKIIVFFGIQAVSFLPHSIPRRLQYLKEFRKFLNLKLPEIDLVKAYAGQIPVAQKSLSSLEERIENARKTIMIRDLKPRFESILLIDDAVGSGATLNETAKKLKAIGIAKKVVGFAVVGSMKGFEVIREV